MTDLSNALLAVLLWLAKGPSTTFFETGPTDAHFLQWPWKLWKLALQKIELLSPPSGGLSLGTSLAVSRYPVSLQGPSQDPCAEDISPLGGSHTVLGPGLCDEFNSPVSSPSPVYIIIKIVER